MKKLAVLIAALVACFMINSFITPAASASPSKTADNADLSKVMEARIENMLNNNSVFGEEFLNNEALVNKSAFALREYADDEGFIPEEIVVAYIKDMYDIDMVITEDINSDMPQKQGCVFLIPRGYSEYYHTVLSLEETKECITVTSAVFTSAHDGGEAVGIAKTVLVRNSAANFGFNILSCEVSYNGALAQA